MSDKEKIHHLDWRRLKDFATEALAKVGVTTEDASIIADTLVEADLRGAETHGVIRLAPYIKMIAEGNMNPRPALSVVRETPVTAVIDADNGVGNLVCVKATEIAIRKAQDFGVGMVGVKNSTHNGALACYPMMALEHDMIGLMTTNGTPWMPAYGGVTRLMSTNPIAAAIPAGEELPVVIDMATTVVTIGKLRLYAKLGKKLPLEWGLDRHGRPTADPGVALKEGFLTWMGGPKGYALAVLVNILSGVLTGGPFSPRTFPHHDRSAEYGTQLVREGHFIMALKVDNFMPVAEFKSRMDAMIREFRASEPAEGFSRVYLPGEQSFERKSQRQKTGIPVSHVVWEQLLGLKEKFGLSGFE